MNFTEVTGPYGGANSFLATLRRALERHGVSVTNRISDSFDVALLNALTDEIDLDFVRAVAERGIPIVHRKVGYRVSGSPEMRRVVDGVVWGDRLQLDFTPFLAHTIFQSAYSRDVFLAGGFAGECTVIHNGVDERVFNQTVRRRFSRAVPRRPLWDGREPFRVVISTWSTDENKGFEDYRRIDAELGGDVRLSLVGRTPPGTAFRNIEVHAPRPPRSLAALLKRSHGLLQLARYETCSNALIEGINCGLPPIFLDSGSNAELAGDYGVPYEGEFLVSLDLIRERYSELVERTLDNPYRGSLVVERYLDVLERVAS